MLSIHIINDLCEILEDNGAAKVGVVETTRNVQSYSHPSYPNLIFYDLPGYSCFSCFFFLYIIYYYRSWYIRI